MSKKLCKYCKNEFVPEHGNDGYCTDECSDVARKLRGYLRYNSVSPLLPMMLANHTLLDELFKQGHMDLTVQELESEGLDFSIFRRLYPDPSNNQFIRLDFGSYYLDTIDNFQTFKLNKHETKTSQP